MIKASNTILFKSADEPYLDAEWIGSYAEAESGETGDIPHFIGNPKYIIPRQGEEYDDSLRLYSRDKYTKYFKIVTNIDYEILCSDDPYTESVTIPTHSFLKTTDFTYSETIPFVNNQFKNLSKIPDSIIQMRWVGKVSQDDLNIGIKNGIIDLGQKAIGALLIMYFIKADVYAVQTHVIQILPDIISAVPITYAPRIYGIFAKDGSITTSLRFDPPKE